DAAGGGFAWEEDPGAEVGPLHRALAFDKTVWLPGTLLQRGDRMTMAASLEGRMPFMDVQLCAFAARLPDEAFLNAREGKQILRRAMDGVLPEPILTRPKSGFRVPVHEWLRGRLRDYLHDALLSPGSELAPYFDRAVMQSLVTEHDKGRVNREKELWSLLSLEVFLRTVRRAPREAERPAAPAASAAAATQPTASIIIPTVGREAMLGDLLEALAGQIANVGAARTAGGGVEVIVVDNGPTPSARPVCDRAGAGVARLSYVHAPTPGVVHARNAGVAAATGEYVIFLDDDETPAPGWLASWLALAASGVEAGFGSISPLYEVEPTANRAVLDRMFSRQFDEPAGAELSARPNYLGTGNSMFRRSRLNGGRTFDPRFNKTGGEDTHLIGQLIAEGAPLIWNPSAAVSEVVSADRTSVEYLKQRRFNQAQLRCRLLHRGGGSWSWARIALWMGVGAAQTALHGSRYLLARATGAGRAEAEIHLQAGLGKLFWYRDAGVTAYAETRA
ncbi:MAG: asparagine synthase-related protein, partial [Caulobacterales bacterium]|nr:asparagine synthase-related protein [Caulobacterales bacterium]